MTETIVLRADLREILERNAERESKSVNELVNEAVGLYVLGMQREKIDREAAAYERLHASLLPRFLGEWVAIHNQELVDHDSNSQALYQRIREKYGRTSVLLRQVAERPIAQLWMRTPASGKQAP